MLIKKNPQNEVCLAMLFICLFFQLPFELFSVFHSDTIPMVHVKPHETYKLDELHVRHVLQRLDDEQLVRQLMAPNDEQPLVMDGTHMGLNDMKWYELHAFLSPNSPHLWLIDFPVVLQRHQHKWPPQRMQATQDCTVCDTHKKWRKKANQSSIKFNHFYSLDKITFTYNKLHFCEKK